MNKAVPWRIKGVGFDARAAAIEAARRSGMSLGEWLNSVIADQANADGVEEGEFDADDRLDAVTRRLSTLRDGRDNVPRRERAPRRPRDDFDDRHDDEPAEQDFSRRPMRRQDPFREQVDAEALLENAITAFDRRATRSNERTARALAEVADLIDTNRNERERDDTALASIADRLTHIERKVARPAPSTDRSVTDALTRLERRIDGLSRSAPVAAPAPRAAPVAPNTKRPLAAAIAEVARRQQELDGPEDRPMRPSRNPAPFAPAPAAPAPVGQAPVAPAFVAPASIAPSLAAPVDLGPSPLEKRLAALVERLEKQAAQPEARTDLSGLRGNIDTLTDRIEKMRGEFTRSGSATRDDGITEIRRELSAMAKAVADLAPRTSIAALDGAVRDLASRITSSRIDGVGDAALAPVEGLLHELVEVVRGMDSRGAIESLDRSIRGVAAKLEAFDGAAVADPALAHGIADQTREMRDMLARIHSNQLPSERIEQGLADLSRRVDAIGIAGADPLGRGEMVQRVGEIRAMLDDPKMQEQVLQALDRRLDAIAHRIDAVFGERLDSMQRTVAKLQQPDFGTLVGDLEARIDTALAGGLQAMERTVARLAETASARSEAPPSRLEEMVHELAARVESGAASGAGPETLAAITQQIERLAKHFDGNDRTADTLVSLQHSVSDLFARLEQSQHQAIDLAEVAARTAAADVLRGASGTSPEVVREISEIRSLQDAADHRTHATLTAVHDTLSEVVGRLSMLEDDVADVRKTSVMPVPPPPMPGISPAFAREPEPALYARAERSQERAQDRAQDRAQEPRHARPVPQNAFDDEPDILIEPGAAFDRRPRSAEDDERVEHRPQASFIQAARRAAQVAGAASEAAGAEAPLAPRRAVGANAAPLDQIRAYYASRKRPILLSLAALMMIVGAWQIAKVVMDERPPPPAPAVAAPKVSALPVPAQREKSEKTPTTADAPLAPAAEAPARKAELQVAPGETPAPVAAPSMTIDRAPVGTVAPSMAMPVDTNSIVRALAVSGDPAAQYELAMRYADGKVLARDLKLSQQWFEKAAAKGLVPAQFRLGTLYERGIGPAKDMAQAKSWYQRAADAGNARAMHNLAVLYADGTEGKPNYADAIVWFRRAAEFGVRDSQYNLAILYARGLGTTVNMVESYLWFAAAAAQGDEDAGKKREDVAGRLPAADLVKAKALAAAFKAKTPDAAANDVAPPPGGWESLKPPPRADGKTTVRPKISNL